MSSKKNTPKTNAQRVSSLNNLLSSTSASSDKIKELNGKIDSMNIKIDHLKRKEMAIHEKLISVQTELDGILKQKDRIKNAYEKRKKQIRKLNRINALESPLSAIELWTGLSNNYIIYDSDEMPFNQKVFQATVYGRKNIVGLIITDKEDIFGSFHPQCIQTITSDMNWTHDDNFFVFCKSQKKENVYCKLRSIRMVFDDETFYRVNNAFYLRPVLNERKGKTWDDYCKDYENVDENETLCDSYGFVCQRLIVFQLCD
ncbi:TLDc domain-containing protein [Entamoeba marina]